MAIINLTNTTWEFRNNGSLNFFNWESRHWYIDFISNSTNYKVIGYRDYYSGPEGEQMQYYLSEVGPAVTVYEYDRETQNQATWANDNYRTIQITSGKAVYDSDLIKFLDDNAVCRTSLVTVTFYTNGKGTAVESQRFASGGKAIMQTPSAEGYIFAGWYTNSGLTTAFDFSTSVTSNITLYAKWIPKAIKTKVNGAWNSGTPLVKVNNTWKDVDKVFVKVDGVWQPVINNTQPSIVKCAEFSTTDNNWFNSSSFDISHGYLSFKILTNDPFSFNIDVEFSGSTFAWYAVGIHSTTTPSVVSNYNYFTIDNPILDDIKESYTGTINIPGGNINKYIVIYFDKDIDVGGLSGTFKFLSNYQSGIIYM